MQRMAPVVRHLLLINGGCFLMQEFLGVDLIHALGLRYIFSEFFRPYQFFTHLFVHADFVHFFINMFALHTFGPSLEYALTSRRFVTFYLFTGIGAAVLYTGVQYIEMSTIEDSLYTITIGASGSVFGIFTAFAMLYPNVDIFINFIPIPIKAKYLIIFYSVYELYAGVRANPTDNVAHFAHLGGILFAYLFIQWWRRQQR